MKTVLIVDVNDDTYLEPEADVIIDNGDFRLETKAFLKPLPEKKEILCPTTDGIVTVTDVCEYTLNDYLFDKGYNACIDEITGEEE